MTKTVKDTTDMEIILTETVEVTMGYRDNFDRYGRNYNRYGDNFDRNGRSYNRYVDNFDRNGRSYNGYRDNFERCSLYKVITPKKDHQIQP